MLYLGGTEINDAGCAALAAALDSGTLPALEELELGDVDDGVELELGDVDAEVGLYGIPASDAAKEAVREALARSRAAASACEAERAAMAESAA